MRPNKLIATAAIIATLGVGALILGATHGDLYIRKLFVDDNTSAPGNLITLKANSTNSFSTTCANSGSTGQLTLIDADSTAGNKWMLCDGTSDFFTFPNMSGDVIQNGEVLVGTGAGTAQFTILTGFTSTFTEMDGSPSISGVGQVKVPNGTLTDLTGGVIEIDQPGARVQFQNDRYYDQGTVGWVNNASGTGWTAATSTVYYLPFYVPYTTSFDRMGVCTLNCPAGCVTGNALLGVYTTGATGAPSALVATTAAVAVTPAGTGAACFEGTISTGSLTPGMYWLGIGFDAAVNYLQAYSSSGATSIRGEAGSALNYSSGSGFSMNQSGWTYANGLPATATPVDPASSTSLLRIFVRI